RHIAPLIVAYLLNLRLSSRSSLSPYTTLFRSLLLSLLFQNNLLAQSPTNAYFVQVATYATPKYKDFSKIHSLGYLFAEPQDNGRSEEHTSELQSRENLVCRLLLEKKILHHVVS